MDPETEHGEEFQEIGERSLEISLPSTHHDDKPQDSREIISKISLPSPQALHPNRASQPLVPPNHQPFYTPKHQKDFLDKDIYFAIKWACGILTVAASIIFGIWAPLSYEATIADNDTQDSMVSVLSNAKDLASTANIIASNALDTASAQHEAIRSLYSTIGLMGQLAVMEFCYAQQTLSVCNSYIQETDDSLENLIDQLGHGTLVTTGTESAVPPGATVDPENRGVGAVPSAAPAAAAKTAASDPGAAAPSSEPRPASGAVSSEARPSTGATPTRVSVPTATSPAASQPSRKAPRLPLDAVLGIIFIVIGIGGAVLGFVVWKMRTRRRMLQGE
ncbi:MAG: hypothetical protein Q9161_006590 [Pseudevernia consocians]